MNRTVSHVLYAPLMNMGDLQVRQPFPSKEVGRVDPFLLLHHGDIPIAEHQQADQAGVGPHPHRGFSPVTFIFKGGIRHRDSRRNDSIVYAGGTQWMNAGMGIMHSERPAPDIMELGGRMELIQLWVNTPARYKMDEPVYYPLQADQTPSVTSPDGHVAVNVVAGNLLGVQGPIPTLSPVNAATLVMNAPGKITIPIPADHNALVYLLDGSIRAHDTTATGHHAVVFNTDGEQVTIEALEATRALLLTGLPLNEPVAMYGPFVMTNQTEILEAMRDYRMGKMGILIED